MSGDKLLKCPEAAEYLGVAVNTLYSWRHVGRGPRVIKVGNALRYRRSDVDAWLEQNADPER